MSDKPRILVFTVSAWDDSAEISTWSSFLSEYDPERIANICIRDGVPNGKNCNNFFSVSENKIIKSIFDRKVKTGNVVVPRNESVSSKDLEEHNERYRKMQKKRRPSMLLARELVWKLGKWKTDELDAFLDSFKPDVILYSLESYVHLNRIVEYSIKRTGANAVGYIWDDNFSYKQSFGFFFSVHRFFQRKSLKRLVKLSNDFFAVTDMTKNEADEFFGIDCKVLTKPIAMIPTGDEYEIKRPLKMLYAGGLACGRDSALCEVVDAVRRNRLPIEIDVFTQTELPNDKRVWLEENVCRIYPTVPREKMLSVQKDYDVLLFLEDIGTKYSNLARLSFSSKITDYLSAGKCIFAVGKPDIAPMRYFAENGSAIIASSREELDEKLALVAENNDVILDYAKNAAKTGALNHSKEKLQKIFDDTIYALAKK